MPRVTERQYRQLLAFRVALRRFTKWSESQARDAGLTAAQHQLLLAVRGHDDRRGPTIGEVADYLLLRHHSAVELIDRAEAGGLVQRVPDADDGRVTRIGLTALGLTRIDGLGAVHLQELRRLAPLLQPLLEADPSAGVDASAAGARGRASGAGGYPQFRGPRGVDMATRIIGRPPAGGGSPPG